MFYVRENMSRLKATFPDVPQAEIMRKISDEWNSLSQH